MVSTSTGNGFFSPFVIYVDDVLGREAMVILVQLSQTMAVKMHEPISNIQGWINGKITIIVAILHSIMICGSQLTSHLWYMESGWDPG